MDIAKQRVINMAGYNMSDGHVIVDKKKCYE